MELENKSNSKEGKVWRWRQVASRVKSMKLLNSALPQVGTASGFQLLKHCLKQLELGFLLSAT